MCCPDCKVFLRQIFDLWCSINDLTLTLIKDSFFSLWEETLWIHCCWKLNWVKKTFCVCSNSDFPCLWLSSVSQWVFNVKNSTMFELKLNKLVTTSLSSDNGGSDVLICVCYRSGPPPHAATFKQSCVSLAWEIFGCHMKAARSAAAAPRGGGCLHPRNRGRVKACDRRHGFSCFLNRRLFSSQLTNDMGWSRLKWGVEGAA